MTLAPTAQLEYRFAAPRRWRFDVALLLPKVALEIQGGMWTQGAHARGPRAEQDYEKLAAAAALGWTVLYATPGQVEDGTALKWVQAVLDARKVDISRA